MFIRVKQASVSAHLTLTSLIATYEIISSLKRPSPVPFTVLMLKFAAPVTDNFFSSPGYSLTRASTVENIILGFKAEENDVITITITKTKRKRKTTTITITIAKTIAKTITIRITITKTKTKKMTKTITKTKRKTKTITITNTKTKTITVTITTTIMIMII